MTGCFALVPHGGQVAPYDNDCVVARVENDVPGEAQVIAQHELSSGPDVDARRRRTARDVELVKGDAAPGRHVERAGAGRGGVDSTILVAFGANGGEYLVEGRIPGAYEARRCRRDEGQDQFAAFGGHFSGQIRETAEGGHGAGAANAISRHDELVSRGGIVISLVDEQSAGRDVAGDSNLVMAAETVGFEPVRARLDPVAGDRQLTDREPRFDGPVVVDLTARERSGVERASAG